MQNHSRWVLLRHLTQKIVLLRYLTHKIPTCWYLKFFASPNAKPQRRSVEYRLRWVPNAKLLRWPCTFHVFCVDFICVWYPTQTQFPMEYGRLYIDCLMVKPQEVPPLQENNTNMKYQTSKKRCMTFSSSCESKGHFHKISKTPPMCLYHSQGPH